MKIIITEKIHDDGIELLKKYASVDCRFDISKEELIGCISDYDAMIVRAATLIDRQMIDAGKNLKAIGMAGIGLNHIDTEYAKQKNIGVFNVPDGSYDSVAELTMALMLNIVRKVNSAVYSTKHKKEWNKHGFIGRQLKDKVVGIIAMGKIGCKVARCCQSFDMKVIAYDPFINKGKAAEMNVELVELDELLRRADVISIHAPLTKETYHLISAEQMEKMKKGSFIINLGRGGIVDENSLYEALLGGHLAGAALDVMENEPPGESKLFKLDNFISTPHIGAGTVEAQQYIAIKVANQVLDHLKLA